MSNKKRADELFKEAYKQYYTDVYRFCLSYMANDRNSVDDVVQDTFIVLYNKYLAGEEIAYTKAFLFKTAHNFVLKHLRERKRDMNNVSIDEIIEIPSQGEDIDERLSFEEYFPGGAPENEIALMVGDVQRLRVYAEKGFQAPTEVPEEIWQAAARLAQDGCDAYVIYPQGFS